MEKMKMQSLDVTGSNIKKIRELFPHCVTERKNEDGELELAVDFEKLKLELADDILGEGEERYQLPSAVQHWTAGIASRNVIVRDEIHRYGFTLALKQ